MVVKGTLSLSLGLKANIFGLGLAARDLDLGIQSLGLGLES